MNSWPRIEFVRRSRTLRHVHTPAAYMGMVTPAPRAKMYLRIAEDSAVHAQSSATLLYRASYQLATEKRPAD